jgi:hypothetical protein
MKSSNYIHSPGFINNNSYTLADYIHDVKIYLVTGLAFYI